MTRLESRAMHRARDLEGWFESHGIQVQTRLEFKNELSTP